MKAGFRFYFFLLLLYLALAGLAWLILSISNPDLEFRDIMILLTGGFVISSVAFYIFRKGFGKEKGKPVLYTLISIGIKFLLYLALLGIYAILSDNLSIPFLIAFFVIYLSFTSYLLFTFVSLLKSKKQTVPDGKEN